MIGRVVEIAEDGRHLSVERGFMVVESGGQKLGRMPLDDIGVLVVTAHGVTYTNNLLTSLAGRGAGVVLCTDNFRPTAWLWPLEGHHVQAARMAAQLDAPRPLGKRLWQVLVRAKIRQQAAVLESVGKPSGSFDLLARMVRSGDPENIEAQAARRYWPLLMGPGFRRDPTLGGVNGLLNYGYGILPGSDGAGDGIGGSASIDRHASPQSLEFDGAGRRPYGAVPTAGRSTVVRLAASGCEGVTMEAKRTLAGVLSWDLHTERGVTPLSTCLTRVAGSLAQAYQEKRAELDLPLRPLPMDLADAERE